MQYFTWLDKQEYPFAARYFTIHQQRLHYIDEGQGSPIVYVHGTPSWSFDFRNIIRQLSSQYRCIAIDHIGFGLSDKPAHYDYSTQNHSRTLESFIQHAQLKNITLVMHDFGGPIGFDYALKHPDNVKQMVVINSWLWSSAHDPAFIKFSKILKNPLLPFLYRYFNFSPKYLLPQSFGDHKLPKRLLKQYTHPFSRKSERNGMVAFAQSLLNDQDWFETLWNKRKILQDKPILFIWGMQDQWVTPQYLDKFSSGFPKSVIRRIETAGHFPQEESPEEVAKAMTDFFQLHPKEQQHRVA